MLSRFFLIATLSIFVTMPNSAVSDSSWRLLEYQYEGQRIVMKVMDELPPKSVRERFGWLTVVSWEYDGTDNNGMPAPAVNAQMISLEQAIDEIQENDLCLQVYSKTGNGRKELVYYINDRDEFMQAFNDVLADHPRYPLDIEFFDDPEWSDLRTVHDVYLAEK